MTKNHPSPRAPSALMTTLLRELRALRAGFDKLAAARADRPAAALVTPAPVALVTLVGYGGLNGYRELVVDGLRLPLNPQEFLLLRALAQAPRGKYIEVPDLLDELADLRADIVPQGSDYWADCNGADIYRLVSKLRKRLALHGLHHLLETCPCPGGGYRLNAESVSVTQGEATR